MCRRLRIARRRSLGLEDMGGVSNRNFGLVIAFVLPGFAALWGLSRVSSDVSFWLSGSGSGAGDPTVGGFCYVSLASLAAGMTVSAVRWLLVDTFLSCTGVRRPRWDDSMLVEKLEAFEALVENHYRYYQFYANTFVALAFSYAVWRLPSTAHFLALHDVGVLFLLGVFLAGSRDALRKYYCRSAALLGTIQGDRFDDQRPRSSVPHAGESQPSAKERSAAKAAKGQPGSPS